MSIDQSNRQLASDLRTVVSRLIKKLRHKSISAEKLSLTERSTMALLDQHRELLPGELAAMEKITAQSMSQIIHHLLELGYIIRRISDTDKRKSIISLSRTGQAMLYKMRNERDEWLSSALIKACNARDQDMLRRAIGPLTRLVDFD
ncbi:MAG: MarR family transcriptional regulator [Puia sp.]